MAYTIVYNSPPSVSPVPEREDSEVSGPTSNDSDERSAQSLPTEYGQSFRPRGNHRPRNPTHSWQARNLSNIIPNAGGTPDPPRPLRRPPPTTVQRRNSQVFPDAPRTAAADDETDVNNNPAIPLPPIPARGRRTYPQARAQTSSIFAGGSGVTTREELHPRQNNTSRWPWQERAKKSVIFDILCGNEDPMPAARPRTYQWDQRKSTLNITEPDERPATSTGKQWPWQERAQQSVIFRPPEKPDLPRQIKFDWDQRRSRIGTNPALDANFQKGSHYTDNFVKWQAVNEGSIKAAGIVSYKNDEEENEPKKSGKRRGISKPGNQHSVFNDENENEVPDSIPPPKQRVRSVPLSNAEGTTCMEVVPVDYNFD